MTEVLTARSRDPIGVWLRRELTLHEGPWAIESAIRALAAGAIIGILAWSVGSIALGGIAFFGACRGIVFSGRGSHRQELTAAAAAAAGGLSGLAVAGSTSHDPATATIVAIVCGFISGALGLRGPAYTAFALVLMIALAYGQFSHTTIPLPQQCLWYAIGSAVVILVTAVPRRTPLQPFPMPFATRRPGTASRPLTNGIRLALCIAPATAIAACLPESHSFWLPMTVAAVVRIEYGTIVTRTVNRVVGTAIGASAAAILIMLLPLPVGLAIVAVIAIAFAALAQPKLYGLSVIGITAAALMSAEVSAPNPIFPLLRLGDTLIGVTIALVLGLLIWPRHLRT